LKHVNWGNNEYESFPFYLCREESGDSKGGRRRPLGSGDSEHGGHLMAITESAIDWGPVHLPFSTCPSLRLPAGDNPQDHTHSGPLGD